MLVYQRVMMIGNQTSQWNTPPFFGALTWFAPRNADLALLEDWRLSDDC